MRKADSTSGCTPESISIRLETKQLGRNLIRLDECTSTNDVARKFASENAPHGSLVISATQTEGRGRHGRQWISPRGGIWMTLILRLAAQMPIESVPLIGALAVANSIHDCLQVDARVRWPNDVVVEGSKVAGLIAEGRQEGDSLEYVLLGVGINANFESSALRNVNVRVTTLMDLNGGPVDAPKLLCNILLQLEELLLLAQSDRSEVLELLRRRDFSIGKAVRVVTDDRLIVGVFSGYESLDATVVESEGERMIVPTPSAILVEYFD